MADASYFIQSLKLHGFRAYLQAKAFDFTTKGSLAIFAPNASGKSSFIDALEFVFSKDGTLQRLGLRTINNQAGLAALAHNLAEDAGIVPSVEIGFIKGKEVLSGKRLAVGSLRTMPNIVAEVGGCFVVDPIIRGHDLRSFVEVETPEQRYASVATSLQLGPLVDVQRNIRALRTQVKAASEDPARVNRANQSLAKESRNVVKTWETSKVLAYVNTFVLAPLDCALVMTTLDSRDAAYLELGNREQPEEQQAGLSGLRQTKRALAALWNKTVDEASGKVTLTGAIPTFEDTVVKLSQAEAAEIHERQKAADAAFQALWTAAEPLFAEGALPLEACPICLTPIQETEAGSMAGVRNHVAKHLEELTAYASTKRTLDQTKISATKAHTLLVANLAGLAGVLDESEATTQRAFVAYRDSVDCWSDGPPPASETFVGEIATLASRLDIKIADIEARQGSLTYAKAKARVDRFLDLQSELYSAISVALELIKLSAKLTELAATISSQIRTKVQTLLDTLQIPMNDIYQAIQGDGAIPIRLELPPEDDTNQQRLSLLVDFAANRTGVQPAGYLSDSQIHSLALALRMAAIKRFNTAAPFIALDDIVTSYDADHRRSIAGLIATEFSGFQIMLTTHDERFFNYLKDQSDQKSWQFMRIIRLDADYGPRFADCKIDEQMIEARWDAGESAANEIRQAEEEWLLSVCRSFGVDIRIRQLEKPYAYERSELASALASFLKSARLTPKPVAGVNNKFLISLQKGEIENFGSHFQEGPYGNGSIGDERARWKEFKEFRDQFVCPNCTRARFKRPFDLKKPVCASEGCETPFGFTTQSTEPVAAHSEPTQVATRHVN